MTSNEVSGKGDSAGREEVRGKVEIEDALREVSSSTTQIRSKKELRNHIIEVARHYGFNFFMNTKFGHEDFTVKTRVKFYRKYGKPPTMKILVIPSCLVRRLCSIYKKWPELGEFFLRTALWHEYQHLLQDPTKFGDFGIREEEANRLMMEKTTLVIHKSGLTRRLPTALPISTSGQFTRSL